MSTEKFGSESAAGSEPAGHLWRHTLARIPTLFGRLIYLSSLWNRKDEAYVHQALAQMVGDEQAAATLRRSHARVFQDWLCLNLEQQKADLQEYPAEVPNPAAVLADWSNSGSYRDLMPHTAQSAESQLFLGDLETLLAVLKLEYGAGSLGSEA
jgi:hypothetical protein